MNKRLSGAEALLLMALVLSRNMIDLVNDIEKRRKLTEKEYEARELASMLQDMWASCWYDISSKKASAEIVITRRDS